MNGRAEFSSEAVHSFVDELFGEDLHAKRVTSLAKATLGTLRASSLAVSAIGHGLALAQGGSRVTRSSRSTGCCRMTGSMSTR